MKRAQFSVKGLTTVVVGVAAVICLGSVVAQVKPGAGMVLKANAQAATAMSNQVVSVVDDLEKQVKDAENLTDKISDKGDLAAIGNAGRKVEDCKANMAKLEKQVDGLRKLARSLDAEVANLKKK